MIFDAKGFAELVHYFTLKIATTAAELRRAFLERADRHLPLHVRARSIHPWWLPQDGLDKAGSLFPGSGCFLKARQTLLVYYLNIQSAELQAYSILHDVRNHLDHPIKLRSVHLPEC